MRHRAIVSAAILVGVLSAVPTLFAITNGRPDGNNHPYVGVLVFDDANGPAWLCSGSLLSPTVVLTAGHCTDGAVAARIWMQTSVQANPEFPFSGSSSFDGTPHTNPDFCLGCGLGINGFAYRDLGIVVLSEPVPAGVVSQYASLPNAGRVDALRNKTRVEFVGYGVQFQSRGGGQGPFDSWRGPIVRFFAPSETISGKFVNSAEYIRLAMNASRGSGGFCFGDSGGPDLEAGTNRVLAVNSYVTNFNCAGTGYSQRVDIPAVLAWIGSFLSRP